MAIKVKIADIKTVFLNLLMCVVIFYAVYFIAVSLCIGGFRIEDIDSLLAPFDFKTSPSWTNSKYVGKFHWEHKYEGPIPEMGSYSYGHILLLHSNPSSTVNLISAEVTFFISGLMFALIVEEWVWDYAITVTLIHVGLTTVVMSEFPSADHWWISIGSGLSVMVFGGQLLAYKLFKNNFIYPVLEDF
ncbi:transmembrane protein 244 isoform X1 [Acipenser ruthenus]|uniref:transmembrane protein 244 isoform X1 n=1 Tax=Acipenser ruthenus TaxID=7906 RepID=UPI0027420A24|nr:transmembrane protein 244 isoform X1 [Acipenser ruthenus]